MTAWNRTEEKAEALSGPVSALPARWPTRSRGSSLTIFCVSTHELPGSLVKEARADGAVEEVPRTPTKALCPQRAAAIRGAAAVAESGRVARAHGRLSRQQRAAASLSEFPILRLTRLLEKLDRLFRRPSEPARPPRSRLDLVEAARADPLQLQLAAVAEREARAGDEIACRRRDQHVAG